MNPPNPENDQRPATMKGVSNHWEWIGRVVVFSLLLASAGLLGWSYYRVYLPRQKVNADLNVIVQKLAAEVDAMESHWSKSAISQINDKFPLVQPRLFADPAEIAAWLVDFRDQIQPLNLDIKTDQASTGDRSTNCPGLVVLPATMVVTFPTTGRSAEKSSPYQRFLQFAQRVTSQDKNVDLDQMSVDSGGNSIGRAVVQIDFWMGGKESK
jgi:hypothetical protein